jgi:hypothetical protein
MKFRENDLLLKLDTSAINVEFYSLLNSFYFIILCFCGGLQFRDLNAQKIPARHLKVSTLKVKRRVGQCLGLTTLASSCSDCLEI